MLKDLFLLDPQIIFLNHGSFGACPIPVFDKYVYWQRQLELQPVQFLGVEYDHLMYSSRQELANYLNCAPTDLVYIPNATYGVNIVARSLQLSPGDEILTTDQEYGACDFIWEFICSKTGGVYKHAPITMPATTSDILIGELWRGITAKTKVIFISHITSPTSLIMPVMEICQRARELGILTIIDGAHAPGQIPVDLNSLQPDFYTGNCHKWMLSPKGAGFLFTRSDKQSLIEPLIVSWGYQSKFKSPKESTFVDYLQWTGTKDPAAALSVPAAIEFMKVNHWDDVGNICHQMLRIELIRLSALTNIPPLYPIDSDLFRQMATLTIPRVRNIEELKFRLYNDYKIEIPCIEWNNKHFLRLSVQGYNTAADLDQLFNALSRLIPDLVA
jgi:isopenicillin-N epimerase